MKDSDMWNDPYSDVTGVLLSDAIACYVKTMGLIGEYDKKCLRPASYHLRLGATYIKEGEKGVLTKESPVLVIPPNSLVFVELQETVNIPYYMIARFNLRVSLVYSGLLLGTGPQVDPGFRGKLCFPLHNLSNREIRLELHDRVATIDFTKTSDFGHGLTGLDQIKADDLGKSPILGFGGEQCLLFPRDKWNRSLDDYATRNPPKSSVREIWNRVSQTRRWGFGGMFAAAGLALAMVGYMLAMHLSIAAMSLKREQVVVGYFQNLSARESTLVAAESTMHALTTRLSRVESIVGSQKKRDP